MLTGKSKHRGCLFSLAIPFCDLLHYEMSEEKMLCVLSLNICKCSRSSYLLSHTFYFKHANSNKQEGLQ